MKIHLILPTLATTVFLTSCGESTVREYTKALGQVLQQYSSQLDARIKSDQQVYRDLAQIFATEAERDVYETLSLERQQHAFQTTSLLIEEKALLSDVTDLSRNNALAEVDRTRKYFETEMAGPEQFTPALKQLQVDTAKLNALSKALEGLAGDPALKSQLSDVVNFGKAFQSEYGLQTCKDLERRIATAKGSLADLNDEKKALTKPDPTLDKIIATLDAQRASWQSQLEKNPRFSADKVCK